MSVVIDIVVFVAGLAAVLATLLSAVRTVVLPHGRSARITRWLFGAVRWILSFRSTAPMGKSQRHEVWSIYAPLTLVLLPIVWLTTALAGFTAIFWSLGTHPFRAAFKLAGSSMLTLGFADVDDYPRMVAAFAAAALTIAVLALLLVTYLPTMYAAYSSRETALTQLETFAGEPPHPTEMIIRFHRIGAESRIPEMWTKWRDEFFELRESHTALPAVVLFASSSPHRNWVQGVEAILDAAALWNSAVQPDQDPEASLCIRAGKLALADICDFFGYVVEMDPAPDDPISIDRSVFDRMLGDLRAGGIDVPVEEEEAWQRWRGWRVNYDAAVVALAEVTNARLTHDVYAATEIYSIRSQSTDPA